MNKKYNDWHLHPALVKKKGYFKSTPIKFSDCIECNTLFVQKRSGQRITCSSKCKNKRHYRKNSKYYKKVRESKKIIYKSTCVVCGKITETKRTTKKYCSIACRNAFKRKPNHCITCGIETKKKYCSVACKPVSKPTCKECGVEVPKRHRKCTKHKYSYTAVSYSKECATCGKSFKTNRNNTLYCKANCRPSKKSSKKRRRRVKRQASITSKFSKELTLFEKNKPSNMEIDHIIPLNHKNVCGLHVPWNLQYLSPEDNRKKSNQFDSTWDNDSWN
jgi:hypothetical protein